MEVKLSDPSHQVEAEVTPQARVPTQDEGRAGLRFFFKIVPKWRITDGDARILLGMPDQEMFLAWKEGQVDSVPDETLFRLGDIVGISMGLRRLFVDPGHGYDWLKRSNETFAGRSALEVMLADQLGGISRVRRYIDAELEGW